MTECFGQAEAPAAITVKAPWDYLDAQGNIIESRLGSIGRPAAFNIVAILDDQGSEVPCGERGEICVKAIIQAKPGVDCKEKLGGVKTPKSFEFREQLPRSPAGKVLKNELRKTYWQDQGRAVN
jgi:acyl-CoA synthetase (AMP-forming)/AMP-acid ligase II